tara:strand:+ start:395 stop:739 length:345 start_codon:yes stop_codon:yes gene_type:complete
MPKEISNTEKVINELLIEKYKPVMVVKLSVITTSKLSYRLEEFAGDISKKTGYEVLLFPDEEETSVKIISIFGTEIEKIKELREYIYEKYEKPNFTNIPFTSIKEIIKKRNKDE